MTQPIEPTRRCAYCHLPLSESSRGNEGAVYCCLGCRWAAALTAAPDFNNTPSQAMVRLGIAVFFAVNAMMFSMVLWSSPTAHEPLSAFGKAWDGLLRYLCLVLSLPVFFLLGIPLIEEAWMHRNAGRGWIDGLISLGVVASFVVSAYAVFTGQGPLYLEVGCGVLIAVTLGRWLEASGRHRVRQTLEQLDAALPRIARRLGPDGNWQEVAINQLQVGDCIWVGPDERVPVDGLIVQGSAYVDEQVTTGEFAPAARWPGCRLLSGSRVVDGPLWIRVEKTARESTWQQLVRSVEQAACRGRRFHPAANRWAACFLPLTLLLAVGAFAYHSYVSSPYDGCWSALSVLVVACPCALGVATPLAGWAALGRAARRGILIRDTDAFLNLANPRTICFDKTGTLTTGYPAGEPQWSAQAQQHPWLRQVIAAAIHVSPHPLTRALRRSVACPTLPISVEQMEVIPGCGVRLMLRLGSGQTTCVHLGSYNFLQQEGIGGDAQIWPGTEDSSERNTCVLYAACDRVCHARFALHEQLRPEVPWVINQLRKHTSTITILSGDQPARVERLARLLSVNGTGGLTPEKKRTVVHMLQQASSPVVMVGEGVNDVPSLAEADVSIAVGCGVDAAKQTAHIAFQGDDLGDLLWLMQLARAARATVYYNLFWTFGYNTLALMLASANLLHPAVAGISMVISSFLVTARSLRLEAFPDPESAPQVELRTHAEGQASKQTYGQQAVATLWPSAPEQQAVGAGVTELS